LFGHDLAVAYDGAADNWTALKTGGSSGTNEDYRIWGKKIYAMADGVVDSWANDKPTNPSPPADLLRPTLSRATTSFSTARTWWWVCPFSAWKPEQEPDVPRRGSQGGHFLGLAGNSGNSTGPHHTFTPFEARRLGKARRCRSPFATLG
jgi:hypothetical protein